MITRVTTVNTLISRDQLGGWATYFLKEYEYGDFIAVNVLDESDRWYASSSIVNVELFLDRRLDVSTFTQDKECALTNPEMHTFFISLAVAAGNIYRLILGDKQPLMKRGVDSVGRSWRLSKEVPAYTQWSDCLGEDKDGITIFNLPLKKSSNLLSINGNEIPIKGLTAILVATLFLNDVDMNSSNFGLVFNGVEVNAVKIDPECCFYHEFSINASLLKNKIKNILINENHSIDLWPSLKDGLMFPDRLMNFFNCDASQEEKMETLKKIADLKVDQLIDMLEEHVVASDYFTKQSKEALIEAMKMRHANFTLAYFDILKERDDHLISTSALNISDGRPRFFSERPADPSYAIGEDCKISRKKFNY